MPNHSPITLKVLIPKQNCISGVRKISSPRFSIFDQSPQTPTVLSKTNVWISQLLDLLTSPKKLKMIKVLHLQIFQTLPNIINKNNTLSS